MLREEVKQYTDLTGEDGWHVPIMKVGAYLNGYNKGLEILDKIRAEIIAESFPEDDEYSLSNMVYLKDVLDILDKYKSES